MSQKRTIAWRRSQRAKHNRIHPENASERREKSWKKLYLRTVKLHRARQLGLIWPRREWLLLLQDIASLNVLFVCSRNQWRSPTAEQVWKNEPGVSVRSAGTSRAARRHVTLADIRWADLILVMEEKHKSRLRAEFRDELRYKALHVLDIPDEYRFMDSELVALLREKAAALIRGG